MNAAQEKERDAPKKAGAEDDEVQASAAPLLDHLTELRSRLIICSGAIVAGFAVSFAFAEHIFNFLVIPFADAVGTQGRDPTLFFAPLEKFFTYVRLSLFSAIVLSFPVLAWQTYAFVAPGLYRRERRAAMPFLIAAPILFLLGASLVYFIMMPFIMRFAVGFEAQAGSGAPASYELLTRVGDYLSLTTTLILGFGVSFQLPVLLTLMARAGLVTAGFLAKNRKYAIILIFISAAILTPPDPFSQVLLALPLFALYEISIISVRMAERRVKAAREEAAA